MANKQNIPVALLQCNEGQIEGLPRNPRFIKDERFEKLKKSLEDDPEMLDLRELIVYPHGKHFVVIGGNMRLRAGKELGFETMPCKILPADTPIEKLKAYVIKDNNAFGNDDFDLLANEWDAEFLEECGFDFGTFYDSEAEGGDGAESKGAEAKAEEDNFDEDTEPIVCRCKRGEVWQLGEHRVMCGDSTSAEDVEKLRGGVLADITFTSPPYNAGFGANITKDNGRSKYLNDNDNKSASEYLDFLEKFTRLAIEGSQYVFVNIQMLANNKSALVDYLYNLKSNIADIIVWDKIHSQPAAAGNVLNSEWEFVIVFSKKANRAIGCVPFHGTLKNIVHIPPQRNNDFAKIHNATFPMEFASHFVSHFAKDYVLDLFGGSGTTLIACEQLKRKCLMMELDPHYCDVILARWEKLTGQTAVKIAD